VLCLSRATHWPLYPVLAINSVSPVYAIFASRYGTDPGAWAVA